MTQSERPQKSEPAKAIREREKAEDLAYLRELLPPGTTVWTQLVHVSRSGMSRVIKCFVGGVDHDGKPTIFWVPSPRISRVTGMRDERKKDGNVIGGCGADMGFELVYNLSYYLYPNGYTCTGKGCRSNDHSNGDRNYEPHQHKDGGYALYQRWL